MRILNTLPPGEGQVGQSQYVNSPEELFNRFLSFKLA